MVSAQLPADFLTRVRQILTPFIATKEDREAMVIEAFFRYDPILAHVDLDGSPKVFCVRFVNQLIEHCITPEQHALARLLESMRADCGVNKHAEIDELVALTNALCIEATPKVSTPLPPVSAAEGVQTIATPQPERTPTVFISYSHADEPFAQQLIADLNAAGHACWVDTSAIKGGDEWIITIAEGIINSYAFLPVVTLKALQSRWVQDEILWAKNKNKLIIPVILENVLDHTRFFPLVSYQGVTLFDSDYSLVLPRLLSYLPSPILPEVELSTEEAEEHEITEAATISTAPSIPRTLELAYLERLKLEELLNTEKYTALGGTAQVQRKPEMRAVFELVKFGRIEPHEQPQEIRRFENAVEEIQAIRRCVLLGEPGGGKTTTLWKLAADLVETALNNRTAPIPLLIRLGKWTDADQSLHDFIAGQLGDLGTHLKTLLSEKRAALLLDGLNELPANQHQTKYPQVQHFIQQYPDLLAVVSCRELDYTLDLGFDKINITPLDPLRIREFVQRYLGTEKGDDLFRRLWGQKTKYTYGDNWRGEWENPSGLMALVRNPYMLLMLTSVYAEEGKLPDNRGQLFAKFVDTLLTREIASQTMLVSERHELLAGLLGVAYKMQMRPLNTDEPTQALTVLSKAEVVEILDERRLYLSGSTNILAVGDQVRFTHQLLQEYFAAKYMDVAIFDPQSRVPLQATDIWQPDNWWKRTNWEEAAILLAGLYSDDPTPVVKWLLDAQPELAAQCILRGGAIMPPDETLLLFRNLIPRLHPTGHKRDHDPHARAAVGRALGQLALSTGELLDNRQGVGVIIKNGITLPDIDWVRIPAGEFTYQKGKMRLDYDYEIARYPITYVQFQAFLDDPEGYQDTERWFEGLAANEADKSMEEQYFKYWNHPRENINWYQTIAFCRWLSWRLGGEYKLDAIETWKVRLPTEFEWEKGARANTGWMYPWGQKYQQGCANIDEIKTRAGQYYLGQTSVVGIYPDGDTHHWEKPISDLSGNVLEWCMTDYSNPQSDTMKEDISTSVRRVRRGGTWGLDQASARATDRYGNNPSYRFDGDGFRVCRPVG